MALQKQASIQAREGLQDAVTDPCPQAVDGAPLLQRGTASPPPPLPLLLFCAGGF